MPAARIPKSQGTDRVGHAGLFEKLTTWRMIQGAAAGVSTAQGASMDGLTDKTWAAKPVELPTNGWVTAWASRDEALAGVFQRSHSCKAAERSTR